MIEDALGVAVSPGLLAELAGGVVTDSTLDKQARTLRMVVEYDRAPEQYVIDEASDAVRKALRLRRFDFIIRTGGGAAMNNEQRTMNNSVGQPIEPPVASAPQPSRLTPESSSLKAPVRVPSAKKPVPAKKKRLTAQEKALAPGVVLPDCLSDATLIYGETIAAAPIEIATLLRPREFAVIWGEIFKLERKTIKDKWRKVTFNVTDYSDSVSVSSFLTIKQSEKFEDKLHEGDFVLLAGEFAYDEYTKENVFKPASIVSVRYNHRPDTAPEKRVELHLHTNMSAMDGMTTAKKLVARAAYWGHPAVAITDHGVVQAFPEAAKAGKELGVKILYGIEGYYVDDRLYTDIQSAATPTHHIIILAKTRDGLRNLYRLISKSNMDYFYKKPRMPRSVIEELREGLIIGSACEAGELYRAILDGKSPDELLDVAAFYDYIEIMPIGNNAFMLRDRVKTRKRKVKNPETGESEEIVEEIDRQPPLFQNEEQLRDINRTLANIADTLNKPLCATGDVHFLEERDAIYREILQSGQAYDDASEQAPLFFKTTDEMLSEFAYLGEEAATRAVVTNPRTIADACEVLQPIPWNADAKNGNYPPDIPGSDEELRRICYEKARAMYGDPLPDLVEARLERELAPIVANGFAVMYMTAQKLVAFSQSRGYEVGSRGSVGSSVVASFADISEVNPLPPHYLCPQCQYSQFITDGSVGSGFDLPPKACPKCGTALGRDGHDIPFETFLGFKADKLPDIDLNFSGDIQSEVHSYTEEIFGKENCYKAGTIQVLQDKTAYGFVKKYIAQQGITARRAEVDRLVNGCVGIKRTTGQHPGGMVVVPAQYPVEEFTPVQYPADKTERDMMTTHFDFKTMLHDTLLKLDILGHDVPTFYKHLEALTGIPVREADVTDPKLYELFQSPEALGITADQLGIETGTLSIPEMGTRNTIQMLLDAKPQNFSDLLQISGLSHGTDVWHGNAKDLLKSDECTIKDVIGLRDNIMLTLMQKGMDSSMAFTITEIVRKGQAKKAFTEEIFAALRALDLPDWYIESCLKIKYMFPKAHAAAYVIAALRLAWYKLYHPLAYYAVFLTVKGGALDVDVLFAGLEAVAARVAALEPAVRAKSATPKECDSYDTLLVIKEMLLRNVAVLPTDLYKSTAAVYTLEDGKIRLPFSALPGIGEEAAKKCAAAREKVRGAYLSVDEFRAASGVGSPVVEALRTAGALAGLPEADQLSLF
ncbi:MAG: PolC-type DNA polymerase III [Oscillospiraceae bacterium]|jgi:DNA polymerase-3 subunit alpha (Gram-positive type)|nr:PolC-type DNA polymerase III [Oscillospiraceae bacterium]